MNTTSWSVKQLLLGLSAVALLAVMSVGGIGWVSSQRLASESQDVLNSGAALQANGQADMMHDAMRADVLAALLAAGQHDRQGSLQAQEELQEHSQQFAQALEQLRGMDLDAPTRALLDEVKPALQDYQAQASALAALAPQDLRQAERRLPAFLDSFKRLESAMEQLGQRIEARAQEDQGHAVAIADSALTWIVAATALAAGLLLALSLSLASRIVGPMQAAVKAVEVMAQGHLGQTIAAQGPLETARMLEALNLMGQQMVTLIGRLREDARLVSAASEEIAQGSTDLSQRTERQAAALEQAAATMAQLGSSVNQHAAHTQEAQQRVASVADVASQSEHMVSKVVHTMQGINSSAQRMSDIVGLIDSIAFQTNILALNAAVEAARAGEQGRGFAVVASEVRSLASRSATAAKEIKQLIDTSVDQVNQGSTVVGETGHTMRALVGEMQRVSALMHELNAATHQQATAVSEMVQVVGDMDSMTQQNSSLVEQSAAAAAALSEQAQRLAQASQAFTLTGSWVASPT